LAQASAYINNTSEYLIAGFPLEVLLT
jgi:hypothetical protein